MGFRGFSACVRRSFTLSTKLRGLSAYRRPSFFFYMDGTYSLDSGDWITNLNVRCTGVRDMCGGLGDCM